QTGIVTIPSALVTIALMPIIGALMKKKIKLHFLACVGICFFILFCMIMQNTTLAFGIDSFIVSMLVRGFSLSMLFVPITTLAVRDLRGDEIGQGTGVNTMMRQLGGSFGIALITTFVDHRTAHHRNILAENINNYHQAFLQQLQAMDAKFMGLVHTYHEDYLMGMEDIERI